MHEQPWDGPVMPPVDPQAAARFRAWQKDHALPAIFLQPSGPAAREPGGTRIGGPVWLARDEPWPSSSRGEPMVFVAQVDFASLPSLPDFPDSGVLQFFVTPDMTFGADFNRPERGEFKVLWREDFAEKGSLRAQAPLGHKGQVTCSPLLDGSVAGTAMVGHLETHMPSLEAWYLRRDLPEITRGKGLGTMNAAFDAHYAEGPERHHIGGHPQFTQDDWRGIEQYRAVDRVLLNLWSKDGLMWGDAGQAQFMIRREDLLRRDFSKVYYQWDCS